MTKSVLGKNGPRSKNGRAKVVPQTFLLPKMVLRGPFLSNENGPTPLKWSYQDHFWLIKVVLPDRFCRKETVLPRKMVIPGACLNGQKCSYVDLLSHKQNGFVTKLRLRKRVILIYFSRICMVIVPCKTLANFIHHNLSPFIILQLVPYILAFIWKHFPIVSDILRSDVMQSYMYMSCNWTALWL